MTGRVQTLRSSVAGNRPTGRQPGELYVNFPDKQLGVVDSTATAVDLLAVRFFSPNTSYNQGDYVVQGGKLYTAKAAVSPGAFNSTQWSLTGGNVAVSDTAPATPDVGTLWFDSAGGQLYVWYNDGNTTQWVIATNAAKTDLSGLLPLAGGTMTGPIVLAGDAGANLNPVSLQQMNSSLAPYATTASVSAGYQPRVGVTNGSNAPAGQVGEYLTVYASAGVAAVSGTALNLTSLALTAGDWEVWGTVSFYGGTANIQAGIAWVNTVSASAPPYGSNGYAQVGSTSTNANYITLGLSPVRWCASTGGTFYLSATAVFGSGGVSLYGTISARRIR